MVCLSPVGYGVKTFYNVKVFRNSAVRLRGFTLQYNSYVLKKGVAVLFYSLILELFYFVGCKTLSTHSQVFSKTEIFFSEYGYRPHVTSVFGHRKRRF